MDPFAGHLDPEGLEILGRDEARDLVAAVPVGRVAFCDDSGPTVLPVNHLVDAWAVVFRTGYGSKLLAAVDGRRVAFEADGFDAHARTGWSVVVRGRAEHVTDAAMIDRLEALDLRTWADAAERPRWVRIGMEDVSGRRIVRDARAG